MTKSKKSLLLSTVVTLALLTGCTKKEDTIVVDGDTYVKSGDEYVLTIPETNPEIIKRFEPGTHIVEIRFNEPWDTKNNISYVGVPFEIPEGYELYDFDTMQWKSSSYLYLRSTYVFINTKTVDAVGVFEELYNKYVFKEPGTVVEDMTLGLN